MTATADDKRAIAAWLTRLLDLTGQPKEKPVGPERLADYAEMLALDLPAAAFSNAALYAVARREWFPACDVIRREVGEHWRDNQPVSMALPRPDNDGLSSQDRALMAATISLADKALAQLDAGAYANHLGTAAETLRGVSQPAWRALLRTDPDRWVKPWEAATNRGRTHPTSWPDQERQDADQRARWFTKHATADIRRLPASSCDNWERV